MPITAAEWLDGSRSAHEERIRQGRGPAPEYRGSGEYAPLIWFDQYFAQEIIPTGTIAVESFEPLRVGSTQSSIDIVVVASHGNTGTLLCPIGSSITVELYQSDTADGTYEKSGYSVTVTNDEARNVEQDCELCRVYIGNMSKPWCRPKITFTGVFAGGTVDVGLAFSAR